jgi:hypothetical protein
MTPMPKAIIPPGGFGVLTLTEPWASLVVLGEKEWETRGWSTSYRGLLLIQAAKTMPEYAQEACATEPFKSVLARHGLVFSDQPTALGFETKRTFAFSLGAIVGAVDLVDTARTERVSAALTAIPGERARNELAFGYFDAGRWAFRLANPRKFAKPIPVRGQLGIWPISDRTHSEALLAAVREQLAAGAAT